MPDRLCTMLSGEYLHIPGEVLTIIDILEKNGHEAFIVGGCVRDMLLGLEPKDFDICTSALPEQVLQLFPKCIPTGIKHGTVTVLVNDTPFEVTTYRIESGYTDFRHPDNVMFSDSLTEDLKRRDFTINAMAYHPARGVVDPFDGIRDLKAKVIRTVGNPYERFGEDALRMLRAIRFQAVYGFSIENKTFSAIKALSNNISVISRERILEELNRILLSSYPETFINLLDSKLLSHILPVPLPATADLRILTRLPEDIYTRWAAFLFLAGVNNPDDIRIVCTDLKMSNRLKDEILMISKLLGVKFPKNSYTMRLILSETGTDSFARALSILKILYPESEDLKETEKDFNRIISEKHCISLSGLAVKGSDLLSAGFKPGKNIGTLLNVLFTCVLQNPDLNRKELLMLFAGIIKNKFGL